MVLAQTRPPVLQTKNGKLYAGDRLVIKGWESFSGWCWFGVEKVEERRVAEGSDAIWFGLVQGDEEEWGEFSESELRTLIKARLVWPIKPGDLPHAGRRR